MKDTLYKLGGYACMLFIFYAISGWLFALGILGTLCVIYNWLNDSERNAAVDKRARFQLDVENRRKEIRKERNK